MEFDNLSLMIVEQTGEQTVNKLVNKLVSLLVKHTSEQEIKTCTTCIISENMPA